jgi:hypothetical protein
LQSGVVKTAENGGCGSAEQRKRNSGAEPIWEKVQSRLRGELGERDWDQLLNLTQRVTGTVLTKGRLAMKNYGRFTSWLIGVWFFLALSAAALNVFRNDAERVGIAVAIAALAPIVVFAVRYAASEGFRKFAMPLNPRILTALQT